MDVQQTFLKLATALALGLLVGLQRERVDSRIAGVRTFPLITLLGAVTALAAPSLGPWLVAAGMLAFAAMLVIANIAKLRVETDPGLTTEIAALLMYGVGAYLVVGHGAAAVAVGGAVVLLLHLKQPLHRFVAAMGERDVTAIMQFALITLVILPVLPNRNVGPYDALNPRTIWLMVVLVVSISLAGYVAYKLLGARAGSLLAGVLGGLVSSTATTVTYARRSREITGPPRSGAELATLVIVVASTIAFARVIAIVAVVAPAQIGIISAPLAAMFAWMGLLSAGAYAAGRRHTAGTLPETVNPAELVPALAFGALFALITLVIAFVKQRWGDSGLYPVALASGLVDMDAIALSAANLAHDARIESPTAWRVILLAGLSNIVFKGVYAFALGSAALRGRIAVFFGLALAGGASVLLLWPAA